MDTQSQLAALKAEIEKLAARLAKLEAGAAQPGASQPVESEGKPPILKRR